MDISDILDTINSDLMRKGSYDRYPIRFFSIKYAEDTANNLMKLRSEIENVSGKSVEIIDIRDFLPHEDGWVTIDNFRNQINKLEFNKNYIIVGFSEYARFLSNVEFETMIIGLLETENSDINYRRRIYIPCFALFSQIKKTVKEKHRRMDAYNPFLNDVNVEDLPIIYFINESLDTVGYENEINNSSEWFGMWRNPEIDVEKPIICTSKILLHFYGKACPDNVYNIKKIITYENLLQYLYGIEDIFPAKSSSEEYYKKLLKLLKDNSGNNLQNIILKKVNAQMITIENIYSLWKNSDDFGRWLIQNYVLRYEKSLIYLEIVMKSLDNLSSDGFVEAVYACILNESSKENAIERRKLIFAMNKVESICFTDKLSTYFQRHISSVVKNRTTYDVGEINFYKEACFPEDNLEKISDAIQNEVIPLLTDCSDYERRLVIWLYRAGVIDSNNVKKIYPNLYDYIETENKDVEEENYTINLASYFDLYRKARLLKDKSFDYNNALVKWNQDEDTFYTWYTDTKLEYPEIILKKQGFNGNTYVLDGVGAEFMVYIVNLLNSRKVEVKYCSYSKAHLPSITSVAKESYNMKYTWVLDYDKEVIHGQIYYPVFNIENALNVIEKMINKIIIEEGDNEFAITADHGATIGHKIYKRDKKYNFASADHDGRCYMLPIDAHENSTNDYLVHTDDKNREWLISLNEQSLFNNSKYVVHGGATPEEVIIPVIIAHKSNNQSRTYKVKAMDLRVSGLDKKLVFKINPNPEKVRLQAKDGTDTWLEYDSLQKVWNGDVNRGIEQEIKITVENQEFNFKTSPTTKMGDDLFDD